MHGDGAEPDPTSSGAMAWFIEAAHVPLLAPGVCSDWLACLSVFQ